MEGLTVARDFSRLMMWLLGPAFGKLSTLYLLPESHATCQKGVESHPGHAKAVLPFICHVEGISGHRVCIGAWLRCSIHILSWASGKAQRCSVITINWLFYFIHCNGTFIIICKNIFDINNSRVAFEQ